MSRQKLAAVYRQDARACDRQKGHWARPEWQATVVSEEFTSAHTSAQATGSSAERSPTACGAEPGDVDTAAHLRLAQRSLS